ncbi:sugar ABC transporter substrate-binding protein, partial [Pseudomonas syringae pv. tagetis]
VFCGLVQVFRLDWHVLALRAQEQVSIRQGEAGPVSAFDALLPGWRDDVLTAQNQQLGDILRELGRYRPGLLRWEPE